jgi:hypothetical protein|tara:strand:- start:2812 stop:3216 length:405 start_codon:yes stop_codon:yes gene_type:complete
MADAVSSTTIIDGTHRAVIQLTNLSDGTGESAVTKVDVSGLNAKADGTACSGVTLEKVHHSVTGFTQVQLFWDASTDTIALALAESSNGHMDFSEFGGIKNTSGSGKTGDINLTTIGAANLDTYVIVLDLLKHY